ncbi:YbhN family protein [Marinitoga arctica]
MRKDKKRLYKKYLYGFLFSLIATIVIFIVISGIIGFSNSIQSFFGFNYLFLILGFIFVTLKWFVESYIIKIFINNLSLKHALNFTLIGQFYSYLTPFYTGGQPFQIIYISKYGVDAGEATAIILFKTLIFQINLAFLGLIGTIYSLSHFSKIVTLGIILGTSLNSVVISLILFYVINQKAAIKTTLFFVNFLKKIGILKNPEKYTEEIISKVKKFIEIFKTQATNIGRIIILFLLSFLQIFFSIIPLPIILKGFNVEISKNIIFRTLITQISSTVIPTPGTSGGAEGIFYLMFSNIINSDKISATIVLWRFTVYYYVLLVGGIVVFFNHLKKN